MPKPSNKKPKQPKRRSKLTQNNLKLAKATQKKPKQPIRDLN